MINEYYVKNNIKEITNRQINKNNNNLNNLNNYYSNDNKFASPKTQKNYIRENRQWLLIIKYL